MKRIKALAIALSALGLTFPAFSADSASGKVPTDSQILSEIHHANRGEIELSHLAETRSTDKSVLSYARKIIDDHSKADEKTMALADREKIKIQSQPKTQEESATQARLSTLEGREFDLEYTKVMEKDHTKVINRLTSAEKELQNPEVKRLIGSLLPTLHAHHDQAAKLEKKEAASG